MSLEESRALGEWLPVLSRVLAKATGVWDWNIVQNNGKEFMRDWKWAFVIEALLILGIGAAAAQVVKHVHFHVIPRPALTPELRNKSFTMFGRGQRSELDDEEAVEFTKKVREELVRELDQSNKARL